MIYSLHTSKYNDTLLYESKIKGDIIMARGVRKLTLDEQLENITEEIGNMEESLKEMKKAKKELEEQIRQNKLEELDVLISESGLSFEQVRELLENRES